MQSSGNAVRFSSTSRSVPHGEGGAAPGAGVPKVGDDVVLGCGCVLLGDIEVGDGSVIGANAVVTKSVPAGCVAVGVPARVVESH